MDAAASPLLWSGLVDYVVTPADGIILPKGTLKPMVLVGGCTTGNFLKKKLNQLIV